ncbi:MAG: FAD:protein FMN transferase [Candidatus Nanopelagicales bacterium]
MASLAVPGTATPGTRAEVDTAVRAARDWLDTVEAALSPYQASSDLCRWRSGSAPRLGLLSPLLSEVVDACADLNARTGGGFAPIDRDGRYDPSGYVKGWAVQRAAQVLGEAGVTDACLAVGGDIQMRGTSDGGRPWRTAVGDPGDGRHIAAVLEQPAGGPPFAVATSGSAQRGAHIWSAGAERAPAERAGARGIGTGPGGPGRSPAGRRTPGARLSSVTVVGPDLGRVDAFATAIWARALREPLADAWSWLAGTGYEALTISDTGSISMTPGMPGYLHQPHARQVAEVTGLG